MARPLLTLAIAMLCVGCPSSDEVIPATPDAAIVVDAAPPADAAVPDAGGCPACTAPLAICLAEQARCVQCQVVNDCAGVPFTSVCDDNSCKECATTTDCTNNADSFGPTCDSSAGTCGCTAASDCMTNPNGGVCHATVGACTCVSITDCTGGLTCQPQTYLGPGVMTCQSP